MSVTVAVDDREPARVVRRVRAHPDVESLEVRRLDAGDLAIGSVGIERKTPGDYLSSTIGRGGSDLRDQLRRLREGFEHAYLLVEGTLANVEAARPGVADSSVRGSVASVTARQGVPVLPCGNGERLVDVAVRLGRKHAEDPSRRPLDPGSVPSRREPVAKRMYACIEGVGPAVAAALYEAFPTVEALADASEAELRAVEGVGPTRAATIYEAVHG